MKIDKDLEIPERRFDALSLNNSSTHQPISRSTHKPTNSSTHPLSPEIAIRVNHVSKKFCRYLRKSMLYDIHDIGKNLLGMSTKPDKLRKDEFWAEKMVEELKVEKLKEGDYLNGSGKSTILKMLNGRFNL